VYLARERKSVKHLAVDSSGEILSARRPHGHFLRHATKACSSNIDVISERRDLIESRVARTFSLSGLLEFCRVYVAHV
jgi:hypothetical protein